MEFAGEYDSSYRGGYNRVVLLIEAPNIGDARKAMLKYLRVTPATHHVNAGERSKV